MHEFALAQYIVSAILPQVPAGARVSRINLAIGVLAGVSFPSLEFGFSVASKDSAAEGAELAAKSIGLTCRCRTCKEEYPATMDDGAIEEAFFRCPSCGAGLGEILTGREMSIESIEIEES